MYLLSQFSRGYDEANWAEKVPIPKSYLPTTTVEQFPDPVTQRLTFRRYNSEPAGWQVRTGYG